MSILSREVSFYPSVQDTKSGRSVSLLKLLLTDKYKLAIERLRSETDGKNQQLLKLKLPCYTVSGVFKERDNNSLILPSGLAAVDLDSVEDYDPIQVLHELKKLPYIAYCGLSCRGKRLFCIVPLLYPEHYISQYNKLIRSFEDIGLPMGDSCHKSLSQPRFITFNTNDTQFFNHNAKCYHLTEPIRQYHSAIIPSRSFGLSKNVNAFQWCNEQISRSITFSEGGRHHYIMSLARYCNIKGVEYTDTLSGCLQFSEDGFHDKEISDIVTYIYKKHKENFARLPYRQK